MEDNKIYQEDFRQEIVSGVSVEYMLQAIADSHPEEKGWKLGEYRIETDINDKKYLVVPLTKEPVEFFGKSR